MLLRNKMEKTYTKREVEEAYESGRRNGRGDNHPHSAPETKERLQALEINQTNFMEQNSREHAEIKKLIAEIKQDIKEALEGKANKWVERVLIWVGLSIGAGIIAFLTWFFATGVAMRYI